MPTYLRGPAAAAALLGALAAAGGALAAPSGAAYTTDLSGTVNQNHYSHSTDVYLNGGPCNSAQTGARLPDGTYEFRVTDPSGKKVFSWGEAREFTVVGGIVTSSSHALAARAACGPIVQVGPFPAASANGEYKLWIAPKGAGFAANRSKTDNFRVDFGDPLVPPGDGGGGEF